MKLFNILVLLNTVLGQKCTDTENWLDGKKNKCEDYSEGWCEKGQLSPDHSDKAGSSNNFPELNCCVCGKKKFNNLPSVNPSTDPNVCVHSAENSESMFVVAKCRRLLKK